MKVVLDEKALMPTKAHTQDAGYDLYSRETKVIHGGSNAVFDTGVHVELPEGTCGLLVSKSGLNINSSITSTGLLDEGYTGSIKVKLYNSGVKPYEVHEGDKITQLVVLPVVETSLQLVSSLEETDRGDNGLGSSGR